MAHIFIPIAQHCTSLRISIGLFVISILLVYFWCTTSLTGGFPIWLFFFINSAVLIVEVFRDKYELWPEPRETEESEPRETARENEEEVEGGNYHTGGSPTGQTQQIGTTYPATQKNESSEATNAEKLAKQQADIKARMSPPAQQANYTGDMGPDVNFFPDN
jgi:hypothetical protein